MCSGIPETGIRQNTRLLVWLTTACLLSAHTGWAQTTRTVVLRGHSQTIYLYGSPQSDPVIVSSGDGGWMHLGPHVAEFLSGHGFFAIGFDAKAYLESFTSGQATLRPEDEPGDYKVLIDLARTLTGKNPILIGVSEGAGLSVLAATNPQIKTMIAGVIGLGLPDLNELGWRWKDAVIYLTHRVPDEPTFSAAAIVDAVTPVPLAAIHATHDEFVPVADIEKMLGRAKDPKRLWIVEASNHRFSDNLKEFDQRLLEAIAWVQANRPH